MDDELPMTSAEIDVLTGRDLLIRVMNCAHEYYAISATTSRCDKCGIEVRTDALRRVLAALEDASGGARE